MRSLSRLGLIVGALALLLTACGSGSDATTSAAPTSTTAMAPATSSVPTTATPTTAPPTSAAPTTTRPAPTTSSAPAVTPGCEVLADLEEPEELFRWQVVNDGVMGGRSSGEGTAADLVLVLEGELVTEGGGFSSVRLRLEEPLPDTGGLVLRVRTDGRGYAVTADDAADGRGRVSFRAPLPAAGGEWEEVVVRWDEFRPEVFGRAVDADPFRPDLATEVGLILLDGVDGPFRLEVDRIDVCP